MNNSPFNVKVEPTGDASKCHISGNGTNPNLQVGEEYTITVDTHEAGPGAVTCRIRSTMGNDLDIDIVDNEDGTFNIFYTPHNPGNYVIKIKFGGQDIPGGDFVVTVRISSCSSLLRQFDLPLFSLNLIDLLTPLILL